MTTQLDSEMVYPIRIAIELERHGDEEGCSKTIEAECHQYLFEGGNTITLFRVEAGRLRRFATYAGILSFRELEASNG